jgi:hypothetical protein
VLSRAPAGAPRHACVETAGGEAIAVQVVGRWGGDGSLLAVAFARKQRRRWRGHERWNPLAVILFPRCCLLSTVMFEKGRRSNLVAGGRLFSVYCSRLAIGKKLTVFSVYCSRLAIGKKLTGMLPGASLSCKRRQAPCGGFETRRQL